MDCPLCQRWLDGWRPLHRHLVDEHPDAVNVGVDEDGTTPVFRVVCPACTWTFAQLLRGQQRDAAFLAEHRREMSLVAFDQLMMHWVEDHDGEAEEVPMGGSSGDSERM